MGYEELLEDAYKKVHTIEGKGKTVEEALKIDYDDIVKKLGFIPPAKIHCSYLAKSALKAAIDNFREKLKK